MLSRNVLGFAIEFNQFNVYSVLLFQNAVVVECRLGCFSGLRCFGSEACQNWSRWQTLAEQTRHGRMSKEWVKILWKLLWQNLVVEFKAVFSTLVKIQLVIYGIKWYFKGIFWIWGLPSQRLINLHHVDWKSIICHRCALKSRCS